MIDEHGGRREFYGGDAFFVRRTFSGTWETIEPSVRLFVGYDTPSAS